MPTREEIREGISNQLYELMGGDSEFNKEGGYYPCADLADEEADKLLSYLHSQGVVIKVDRELWTPNDSAYTERATVMPLIDPSFENEMTPSGKRL